MLELAARFHIPNSQQGIATPRVNLGQRRMDSQAPKLIVEVAAHVDVLAVGVLVELEDFTASRRDEHSVTCGRFAHTSRLRAH